MIRNLSVKKRLAKYTVIFDFFCVRIKRVSSLLLNILYKIIKTVYIKSHLVQEPDYRLPPGPVVPLSQFSTLSLSQNLQQVKNHQ